RKRRPLAAEGTTLNGSADIDQSDLIPSRSEAKEINIDSIPDDIIMEWCRYLESNNGYNFALTCKRVALLEKNAGWRKISKLTICWSRYMRKVELDSKLSAYDAYSRSKLTMYDSEREKAKSMLKNARVKLLVVEV
ncbi:hypothetical protein PFISCL1PPCAC_12051, partial [Pristionchus fissidentatus]